MNYSYNSHNNPRKWVQILLTFIKKKKKVEGTGLGLELKYIYLKGLGFLYSLYCFSNIKNMYV